MRVGRALAGALLVVLFVFLVVVLALRLQRPIRAAYGGDMLRAGASTGGAREDNDRPGDGHSPEKQWPNAEAGAQVYDRAKSVPSHDAHAHPLGAALAQRARTLRAEHAIGVAHAAAHGGAHAKSKRAVALPKKHWTEYPTWEELMADEGATSEYLTERAAVINNPNLDWSAVLHEVKPKLEDSHEYIGLVNLGADGRTLRLVHCEASPMEVGSIVSNITFAMVPAALVAKVTTRPALFMFHTHPSDVRCNALPSSTDLVTAIHFSAAARYAANVVISRYGVLVYGLDWGGSNAIRKAANRDIAMHNLSFDIVSAHEAMRSWADFSLSDYFDFYSRHNLFAFVFPSPEFVGDQRQRFYRSLDSHTDYELLDDLRKDIEKLTSAVSAKAAPRPHSMRTAPEKTLALDAGRRPLDRAAEPDRAG
jgi:hypothetical protein